jgi:Yip1-like protein
MQEATIMSEDSNITPNQPEEPPLSEPEQAAPAPSEQYPPLPSFYSSANAPDPYGAPATNYSAGQPFPPSPSYGVPLMPPPSGYGAPLMPPPGYGVPPFAERPRYDFVPVAQPLPLGQALSELPQQYLKILKKPSARSFIEEQGKAEWGIIWMQLLFIAILALANFLITFSLQNNTFSTLFKSLNSISANSGNPGAFPAFTSPSLIFISVEAVIVAILTPFVFLAGVGIQFGMAKLFRGQGQYKQQTYNQLLFSIPVQVIMVALSLLSLFVSTLSSNPIVLVLVFIPSLASFGISIYSIILNVFAIMATHRMSGGKATGVVLIPYGVAAVAYFILIFVIVFAAISATLHP